MEIDQTLDFGSLQGSGDTPLADVDDSLNADYPMDASDDKYRMNLPTLASLQGDYYVGKNVSVNSTFNYAFQFRNNDNKIHEITNFSITPRWDWKWLGVYVPFSYNKYSHVRMGASDFAARARCRGNRTRASGEARQHDRSCGCLV